MRSQMRGAPCVLAIAAKTPARIWINGFIGHSK
jgi:hypothetical protein